MFVGYLGAYIIIILVAVFSLLYMVKNKDLNLCKKRNLFISIIFALCICLGNYSLFDDGKWDLALLLFIVFTLAPFIILESNLLDKKFSVKVKSDNRIIVFLSFVIILLIQILRLIYCTFPAWIQYDTVAQVDQIVKDSFTNHQPVFQTLLIKAAIEIAELLGKGINGGLFLYAIFQSLVFACSVAYTIDTIIKKKKDVIGAVCILLVFVVFPYHFAYGNYIVKDMIFSYCGILLVVSYYRIVNYLSKNVIFDVVIFIIAGVGVCLFRNNGMFAFVISIIVLLLSRINEKKRLVICSIGIIIICVLLKGPVLNQMGVAQTEFSEPLTIPIQQVCRVVKDDGDMSPEDMVMIEKLVSEEEIKAKYNPRCSDPIRGIIQFYEKDDYFEQHKVDYFKLWIRIGIDNPTEYIKAYVDQTRGYWMPTSETKANLTYHGYNYLYESYNQVVFGINIKIKNANLNDLFNKYISTWQNNPMLQWLYSIGLMFWLGLLVFIDNVRKRNGNAYILAASLALVATCMLAAPLYASLRYSYMLFCVMPFALWVQFVGDNYNN